MLKRLFFALLLTLTVVSTAMAAEKNPVVVMETTLGNIKIELFAKEAPISVKNFLAYAENGFYKDTIFHRVIPGFMAQGGGLTAALQPKPGSLPPIKNEADNGLKNDRGTLSMARTGDPNSATSQFFINVVNNDMLNRPNPDGYGYAVFGKVISGMEVVDKIVSTPTTTMGMMADVPVKPVVILSVTVAK